MTDSDIQQDVASTHITISKVHREVLNAETVVPDARRGISNTQPFVSDIQHNKLKRCGGADGQNLAVSTRYTSDH